MAFTWLTWANAKAALAARLAMTNPAVQFWTDAELAAMLSEALRAWNALTAQWNSQFDIGPFLTANQVWFPLAAINSSYPRFQTVTDQQVFTEMGYHLLEDTSAFSGQFTQADFTGALQRRRDEILQASATNLSETIVAATVGVSGGVLPDNVFTPIRNVFAPLNSSVSPVVLHREDDLAFQYFVPGWQTGTQTVPGAYAVISTFPLGFETDFPPQIAGNYRLITSDAGVSFVPPTVNLLGLPDDFYWAAKWGAISDLLNREPESTDSARAAYAMARFRDGLTAMRSLPWLLWATIDGVPVDTPGVVEMDQYTYGWDFSAYSFATPSTQSALVVGGVDFVGTSPVFSAGGHSVVLNVVGNAPIPVQNGDFVQVSRDVFDVILDYAQNVSSFKMGGQEFQQTLPLLKNFAQAAIETNNRLRNLGLFRDVLLTEGQRQELSQPRYTGTE